MPRIFDLVNSKYVRPNPLKSLVSADLLQKAQICIDRALARPIKRISITANPSHFRVALFGEKLPFISVWRKDQPFLALAPRNLTIPNSVNIKKDVTISFDAHDFTEKEFAIMDRALPLMEDKFGDTQYLFDLGDYKIGWDRGMDLQDELEYRQLFHPMVMQEARHLVLNPGDLVCDPACGTGNLLFQFQLRYPQLQLVGSDLIVDIAQKAKELNPTVPIYVADAQDLGYLDLGSVSLFLLCGLVNHSVVTKAEARTILLQALPRAKDYAYFIVAGKSPPYFNSTEMENMGFWSLLRTKWVMGTFHPFYIYLSPRRIDRGHGRFEILPILNELMAE